jgi:hypothetical protein
MKNLIKENWKQYSLILGVIFIVGIIIVIQQDKLQVQKIEWECLQNIDYTGKYYEIENVASNKFKTKEDALEYCLNKFKFEGDIKQELHSDSKQKDFTVWEILHLRQTAASISG